MANSEFVIDDVLVELEQTSRKDQANGYAGLDASGLIDPSELPTGAVVDSLAKSGSSQLTGDVTLSPGANVTLTQAGNDIEIASSGGGGGGVDSLAKSGDTQLTGDVTLSEGTGITLTEVGNDIEIAASGGSGIGAVLFDSTLGSAAATIDTGAGGIAGGYTVIVIHMQLRTTQAVIPSTCTMRVNNDSGANYDRQNFMVVNTTLSGTPTLAATSWAAFCAGANAQAGSASALMLTIPNYDGTVFHKSGYCTEHVADSVATSFTTGTHSFRWRSTAAIDRFAVTAGSGSNFATGCRVTILGY